MKTKLFLLLGALPGLIVLTSLGAPPAPPSAPPITSSAPPVTTSQPPVTTSQPPITSSQPSVATPSAPPATSSPSGTGTPAPASPPGSTSFPTGSPRVELTNNTVEEAAPPIIQGQTGLPPGAGNMETAQQKFDAEMAHVNQIAGHATENQIGSQLSTNSATVTTNQSPPP